jgi:hypothetical protein
MTLAELGMTQERYDALMACDYLPLTEEETRAGWHFCPEWDLLLTNHNDPDGEHCSCAKEKK